MKIPRDRPRAPGSAPVQVGIVSSGSPELLRLARAMAHAGMLVSFVTPFNVPEATRAGIALRALSRVPRVGAMLMRRQSSGIQRDVLVSAAPLTEIARALTGDRLRRVTTFAHKRSNARLRKAAARLAQRVDVLVVSHGCASDIPDQRRARVVLNQPNAHPAYQAAASEEILRRHPRATRATLPAYDHSLLARLQAEYDLADLVLAGSTFVASTLQEHGVPAAKIRVCPYGVDTDTFRPTPSRARRGRPLRVLSVSSFAPHKGIWELMTAAERLKPGSAAIEHFGGAPFGDDWIPNPSGIARGRVGHQEIAAQLATADCFVLASWFEGLPLSVLEALASGLPCIVTATGADQAVRDGVEGFIVPTGDPDAIVQALERLADDEDLLCTMSNAARRRAEGFTWDAYTRRVAREIDSIAELVTHRIQRTASDSPNL